MKPIASLAGVIAPVAAALAATAVLVVGITFGARVAGGSDSSGYLSEARLWRAGRLRVEEPAIRTAPWPMAAWTFAPLGFIPGRDATDLVPFYPPGYPLALASAAAVGRSASSQFLVVPLLAALAVWLTFAVGRRLASAAVGAWAALLLAASPPFLFQSVQPMSDVPATAWWLAATALLLRAATTGSTASAFLAGLAASAGVLTRPNTVPLAAVAAAWLAFQVRLTRAAGPGGGRRASPALTVLAFCAGSLPGGALLAWFNSALYGSPFRLGYHAIGLSVSPANIPANIRLYTGALLDTHGVMVGVGIASLVVSAVVAGWQSRHWRAPLDQARVALSPERPAAAHVLYAAAFVGVILGTYLLLTPMDGWTYLRFLLPAYPLLMVCAASGLKRLIGGLTGWRGIVATVALACVVADSAMSAARLGVLDQQRAEARYEVVAKYLKADLPRDAIVVAMQHTGSVWYYAGLTTVRWEVLDPKWLDRAVRGFQSAGRRVVFLLEPWEAVRFRERFDGQDFGALDWPARSRFRAAMPVFVYEAADRDPFRRGADIPTAEFIVR